MANKNLKDFTSNWILLGLLGFALLSFAIIFTANNNPNAFGSTSGVFSNTSSQLNSNLVRVQSSSNNASKINSIKNSLESSGTKTVSASTSNNYFNSGKSFWRSLVALISYVFSGTLGKILIGVLGGLIAYEAIYWIIVLGRILL